MLYIPFITFSTSPDSCQRTTLLSTKVLNTYELAKTALPAISQQLFHSKLKTLLFNKSDPDSSSSPCLPPRLNTIHHGLHVCLPDSLNLTHCLSILFWTSACE